MQNEKRGNTNSPKRIQICIEQIEERMYVKKDQRGGERGEAGQTGGGQRHGGWRRGKLARHIVIGIKG